MEYINSLDLENTSRNKAKRVRSWYLQEQYKSLEKYQEDAAQKLRDRSYQESLLMRELADRKTRRRIYEPFVLSEYDSNVDTYSHSTSLNLTEDDSFRSLCGSQAELYKALDDNISTQDTASNDDSRIEYDLDFPHNEEEIKTSPEASLTSVIEKLNSYGDFKPKCNIDTKFSETLKNIEAIEKCTKPNMNKIEETYSVTINTSEDTKQVREVNDRKNNVFFLWSRLVCFAYQVMQLNRGNCYYDYSTQIMTAVLACDVLRRGFTNLCHCLQQFVCPIKVTTGDDDGVNYTLQQRKIKQRNFNKDPKNLNRNKSKYQVYQLNHRRKNRRNNAEDISRHLKDLNCYRNKNYITSANERDVIRYLKKNKSHKIISVIPRPPIKEYCHPDEQQAKCKNYTFNGKRSNPMLKVVEFIEDVKFDGNSVCRNH